MRGFGSNNMGRLSLSMAFAVLMVALLSGYSAPCPCNAFPSKAPDSHACCKPIPSQTESNPCSHSCRLCQAQPLPKAFLPAGAELPVVGWVVASLVPPAVLPDLSAGEAIIPYCDLHIHSPPLLCPFERAPPV